MKVLVNGRETLPLAAKRERTISLGAKPAEVAGEVISQAQASAAITRASRFFFYFMSGFCILLIVGVAVMADPPDRLYIFPFALAVLVFVLWLLRWSYRRTQRRWLAQAPARAADLPPPGTAVRLDAAGLTMGDRAIAWPSLSVARLELLEVSGGDDTTVLVDRLLLDTPDAPVALDRTLMKNGAAIVAYAYRRLCRPPQ
jgi:hypothetical protein